MNYPSFRAPWSPDLVVPTFGGLEVGSHDGRGGRDRDRDRDRDDGRRRWGRRGWRDGWGGGFDISFLPSTYYGVPWIPYWPYAPYAYPPQQYPYPYPYPFPPQQYPAYGGASPQYPAVPPPAMIAGGRPTVGALPAGYAGAGDRPMNQFNPYYPSPYGMVGQAPPQAVAAAQAAAFQAAQIQAMQGYVPVYNNAMVPAIRSDLPTNRVLAEVDAVDARAVPVLVPEMGISPRTNLMKGFKHASEKICGKGCGHVELRTDFPFLIERLWVDSHDAEKFDIELIIVGQRVLSTGDGFSAKWLKRRSGRHGFRFDFNMAIDHRHPLKLYVKNRSHHSKRFRIAAWGEQIGE